MSGLQKTKGILLVYLARWRSNFRLIPALLVIIALIGVVATAVAPNMRVPGRSWLSWSSWWQSLREAVIVVVCAIYLRYEGNFRKWFKSRGASHPWKVRMASLAKVIDEVSRLDPQRRTPRIPGLRSDILRCIVSGVAETLDLPSESLCANLLAVGEPSQGIMHVSARSDDRRNVPVSYPAVDGFLPWRAIINASMEIEDNYQEREGIGPRDYKAIVTIPVTKDGAAYGSLSIDCTVAYAFNGRKEQIYYQVRPYIALLALTFGSSSPYHECFFNPAHFR